MASIHLQTDIPGPRSLALFAERQQQVAPGPFHTTPIVAAHAEGEVITDVDGNRFLDFASGIGVTNLGHRDPAVMAAIAKQAEQFVHTSINVVAYEGYIRLAERLNGMLPEAGPCKTFLANSGAEAVENAVKFARAATGRQAVIAQVPEAITDFKVHGLTTALLKTASLWLASLPRPVALHLDLLLLVLLSILHHVASDGLVLSLECHTSQVRVKLG